MVVSQAQGFTGRLYDVEEEERGDRISYTQAVNMVLDNTHMHTHFLDVPYPCCYIHVFYAYALVCTKVQTHMFHRAYFSLQLI